MIRRTRKKSSPYREPPTSPSHSFQERIEANREIWQLVITFLAILCVLAIVSADGAVTPHRGIKELFDSIDKLYSGAQSVLTLRVDMTTEGWQSQNTLSIPQDQSLAHFGSAFGALEPWYTLFVDFRFKPVPFLTLILSGELLPENANRASSWTRQTFSLSSATIGFANSYRELDAEAVIEIGSGDMVLSSRFSERIDYVREVLSTNGDRTSGRYSTLIKGFGWPLDPLLNRDDREIAQNTMEFRHERFSLSLRPGRRLLVEPTITLIFQMLDVIQPFATNLGYDPAFLNNDTLDAYGKTQPSYLINKWMPSLDAKLAFRPPGAPITLTVGGKVSPLFPYLQSFYPTTDTSFLLPFQNLSFNKSVFLNLDFSLTKRVLLQLGANLASFEYRTLPEYSTLRWLDDLEFPGNLGRFVADDKDLWTLKISLGLQVR